MGVRCSSSWCIRCILALASSKRKIPETTAAFGSLTVEAVTTLENSMGLRVL